MLRINLLPETSRKTALSPIEQFHRTPIVWIAVAVMILFAGALAMPLRMREAKLGHMQRTIADLRPKKAAIDEVRRYSDQLRAQEKAFKELGQGEGSRRWSKRLNRLAALTPDGVWYNDLTLEAGKELVIQGSAIAQGGGETVSIGRLVADLKADPDFAAGVKDVQIESIKRMQDGDVEVVRFTLTCPLQEAPAS